MAELVATAGMVATAAEIAEAQRTHILLVRHVAAQRRLFLAMGRLLRDIHDAEWWRVLGHGSWYAYLASPEIDISATHARRMIEVVRAMEPRQDRPPLLAVSDAQLEQIGVIKAAIVVTVLERQPEQAQFTDDWLARAETLAVTDLQKAAKEALRGTALDAVEDAQHDLARKLLAIVHHFKSTSKPAVVLRELIDAATRGLDYLERLER